MDRRKGLYELYNTRRVYYFALLGLLLNLVCCKTEKSFTILPDVTGAYSVQVDGQTWIASGPTFFRANQREYSSKDGSLRLLGSPISSHGRDAFGLWNTTSFTYAADTSRVTTSIRLYDGLPVAIFTQTFVSGFGGTNSGDPNKVVSGFPSFHVGNNSSPLGYLAYDGLFIGWVDMAVGRWDKIAKRLKDGLSSGPLVLFDQNDRVLIISPFDQFMAASFWHDTAQQTISWGIMGRVSAVTEGYTYSTILFYDSGGVNQAVERWGETMRIWYDRRTSSRDLDPTVNYLGYYTDNGGYYYQVPEKGWNFEDTILGIFNYSQKNKIPYRYLQYDDWFYPTAGPTSYEATVIWDAKPSIFPHGLIYLYNKTKLPVVAHNRYWSDTTPYAEKNGGRFHFVFDELGNALPDDPRFWDELFSTAKTWGLLTYEQDWLNYQIESISVVQEDLTLGTRWLHQMGSAAERKGLTIQYCMALPRHLLASLEIPAVSQVRASIDYMMWPNQYQIGLSSLFAHSLGVAPFKDNFWTVKNQTGNRYNKSEDNPRLQAVVALLSTGPVGVSDRIGYSDLELIQRLTAADGLLLKPSRPATAINAQILQAAFGGSSRRLTGDVWTTYSRISDIVFGVILAVNLSNPFLLNVEQGNWRKEEFRPSIAYSSKYFMPSAGEPVLFAAGSPLLLSGCSEYTQMCFYYTSPIFHVGGSDIYIKGEVDKALPVSPKRIRSISIASDDASVELLGSPSEQVDFEVCTLSGVPSISKSSSSSICKVYPCVISDTGEALLRLSTGRCL